MVERQTLSPVSQVLKMKHQALRDSSLLNKKYWSFKLTITSIYGLSFLISSRHQTRESSTQRLQLEIYAQEKIKGIN